MLFRLLLPLLVLGRANLSVFIVSDFRIFAGFGNAFVIYIEGTLKGYVPLVQESLERGWDASKFLAMRALHPGKEGVALSDGRSARALSGKMTAVFKIVVVLDRPYRSGVSLYMVGPADIQ